MALTEKLAADRSAMAKQVIQIATDHGATAQYDEFTGPREIMVSIEAPGGLCISLDFDGASPQPDVFVMSWHMDWRTSHKLNPTAFAPDSVNPHHHRKATDFAYGFDQLCELLALRLSHAATGAAYQPAGKERAA